MERYKWTIISFPAFLAMYHIYEFQLTSEADDIVKINQVEKVAIIQKRGYYDSID